MSDGLLDPREAAERVLSASSPLPAEQVPLLATLGRVLAAGVTSREAVPGFDNSAMDGFAVRAADIESARGHCPVTLAIVDESRAGGPASTALTAGNAIRISTGAMLPEGADAVVRLEDVSERRGTVEVRAEVQSGGDIRRAGEDVAAGARVLSRGALLGPAEVGMLASVGAASASCVRRPRMAILVTGDELVEPQEPLRPGAVRNSNRYSVVAQATQAGAEVVLSETVADERRATAAALRRALELDVVVVCGGISVGVHDHVRAALQELGVEPTFAGVALKPGKPTWFGVHHRDHEENSDATLVFGLPGNPVSAMVTFHLFVRPALAALAGRSPASATVPAIMDCDYPKTSGRAHAVRCRAELRDGGWRVRPTGDQGSHVLSSMVSADALALLDVDRGSVRAGEAVGVELLRMPAAGDPWKREAARA